MFHFISFDVNLIILFLNNQNIHELLIMKNIHYEIDNINLILKMLLFLKSSLDYLRVK